jgi:hypothetical protein
MTTMESMKLKHATDDLERQLSRAHRSLEGSLQDLIADEEDAADAVRTFDEKVNEAMAEFRKATGQSQP